ncbi:hypothetical protein L1049_026722 [Liquidambar formosana]|uniref:Uncharacterized protein n=1 Tax=Liquidambar formosana TaxID=63359 RepID=A0AAP0NE82_LIQFO
MEKPEAKLEKAETGSSSLQKPDLGENDSDIESVPSLRGVEQILGYKFKNRELLEEAFTHPSFHNLEKCLSYERLEHVGDSVLNLLITKELFFLYPDLSPGWLTRLRAANTDNEKLARVAIKLGLHNYLRHCKIQLVERIQIFTQAIMAHPLHSNGLVVAPKILADVVEAAIGAVYIDSDCSIDTVWKVFKSLLEPMISQETLGDNPVVKLQEICQKKRLKLRFVTDSWEEDASVDVFIEDHLAGKAMYGLKKDIAQNRAAKDALDKLESLERKYSSL